MTDHAPDAAAPQPTPPPEQPGPATGKTATQTRQPRPGPTAALNANPPHAVPRWHLHRRMYDWVLHWADTRYGTVALGTLAVSEASWLPIPVDPLLIALALGKPRRAFTYSFIASVFSVLGGMLGYLIGYALWNPVGAPVLERLHFLTHDAQAVVVRQVGKEAVVIDVGEGRERSVHRYLLHRDEPVAAAPVGSAEYERQQVEAALRPGQRAYLMTDQYHLARAWYETYGLWVVFVAAFTPVPYIVFSSVSGLAQLSLVVFVAVSIVGRSARFFLVGGLIFFFGRRIRNFVERYFNLLSIVFAALVIGLFFLLKLLTH